MFKSNHGAHYLATESYQQNERKKSYLLLNEKIFPSFKTILPIGGYQYQNLWNRRKGGMDLEHCILGA